MTTFRNDAVIKILIGHNPHPQGSKYGARFDLIQRLMIEHRPLTVGTYRAAHRAAGGRSSGNGYLRYMVRRGLFQVTGYDHRQDSSIAIAPQSPLNIAAYTFGGEFEFLLPPGGSDGQLINLLAAEGIVAHSELLNHNTRNHWKLVHDGSLLNRERGRELVAPILSGLIGFEQIKKVCRVLEGYGCKITKQCGFHVHIGHEANGHSATYFSRLLQMYAWNEQTIDRMVAPSRRGAMGGNGFCGSVRAPNQTFNTVAEVCRSVGATGNRSQARYRKLNVDCWWNQRTVEFRQHQGTVDATKAINWILFCLHFCQYAAGNGELPRNATLPALLATLNLPADLQAWFLARAAEFDRRTNRQSAAAAA